ncbi:hypothetical protein SCP_0804130 [Sparassis crispa]|uniref:HNH nuclease domain-containing protein n=1 Tax=Sparassis crispa TaxID=139825 RepID=A0A401GUM6_9APHY|nr:hypothetical protein SCP_0804130 [Sparassis crispa]GBE85889.1 hypothetical protein SCP_0804130 [Sparassis crispa]
MEFDTEDYFNEDQRDVHVWCSRVDIDCMLKLVAVNVFYQWLAMIINLNRSSQFDTLVLVPCKDPRLLSRTNHRSFFSSPSVDQHLPQDSTALLNPGHYAPYKLSDDNLIPVSIELHKLLCSSKHEQRRGPLKPASSASPSPKNDSERRSNKTRKTVRCRDKRCVVTGEEALRRNRGYNFTGLEVAHIFPLAFTGDATAMAAMPHDVAEQLKDYKSADKPENAMLLRADVHKLFDNYQFGIWPTDGTLYRFERSGAPVIGRLPSDDVSQELAVLKAHGISSQFFIEHFRVCLSWHVRGHGRRRGADDLLEL